MRLTFEYVSSIFVFSIVLSFGWLRLTDEIDFDVFLLLESCESKLYMINCENREMTTISYVDFTDNKSCLIVFF